MSWVRRSALDRIRGAGEDIPPMSKLWTPANGEGYADVIMGLQHGDEGKGRFVDNLANDYDWIARYNGGANAGHTVEANGITLALHQIPSGVNHPGKKLYIGALCAVNIVKLLNEIREVEAAGLSVRDRLYISSQASVVQPSHILDDNYNMGSVGTTNNGIGPMYGAQKRRVAEGGRRVDVRLGELVTDTEAAFSIIRINLQMAAEEFGMSMTAEQIESAMQEMRVAFEALKNNIDDNPQRLTNEIRNGARVLMESAQAWGLDNTFGVTPNVTGSNVGVAAAFLSTGVPVDYKRQAFGVAKLTPSRVGYGPFVTELGREDSEKYCMEDGGKKHTKEWERAKYGDRVNELFHSDTDFDVGIATRMDGGEYGATTKRPRRMGEFDTNFLKYGIGANGLNKLFLTKGDKLPIHGKTNRGTMRIATHYQSNDRDIDYVPTTDAALRAAKPVYAEYDAPTEDLSAARRSADLSSQTKAILRAIQEQTGCDILEMGVGPERDQKVSFKAGDL